MANPAGKAEAIALLCTMQETLRSQGILRLPQRSDFPAEAVVQIKTYLGPWPRALEAAGLKPPRDDASHRTQRRIAAKRRRTAAKLAGQNQNIHDKGEES